MKTFKFIIPIAGLLLASVNIHSQTIYETEGFIGSDLNGTARFVGMGGAMGALGGDISTMGTNPAGIGIYRSSDINTSFGFSNVGMKSNMNGSSVSNDKFFGSFDNMGFVIALKQGNFTPLRYVNFGFNYRKLKSFDRNVSVVGSGNRSQTQQFAQLMNDNESVFDPVEAGYLNSLDVYGDGVTPWLAPLAYQSNLMFVDNNDLWSPYLRDPKVNSVGSDYLSRERGGLHSYDFNVAFNFNDRFYLGATLGIYSVDYKRSTSYQEYFYDNESVVDAEYDLSNDLDVDGTGVDFKLGVIVRPFESSPLRIGASVSTPTYYNLSEYQSTSLYFETYNYMEGKDEYVYGTISPYDEYERPWGRERDYKMVTPWKYNFSLGYIIGSNVALGAEYEFIDYSTSKFKYDDNGDNMVYENDQVKNNMKGTHAIRLGAEIKLAPEFSLRAGYNHITSSFENNAHKVLPVNSARTDTDYFNRKATNNYTLGFGYRGTHFYADMAYKYQTYNEDFYAFNHSSNTPAKIENDRHQVLFTLGMRF